MDIPASFAQLNFVFSGQAAPRGAQVTFGVALPLTGETPADVGLTAAQIWTDTFRLRQSTQIALASVHVKFGPNDVGPFADVPSGATGQRNEESMEPQVAVLVRKNTDQGGRAGAGRFFLPGIPDVDATSNGRLTGGALAAIQTQATAFVAAFITAGYPLVLFHAEPGGIPPYVTSLGVQELVATQRRRLRKVGGRRRLAP